MWLVATMLDSTNLACDHGDGWLNVVKDKIIRDDVAKEPGGTKC